MYIFFLLIPDSQYMHTSYYIAMKAHTAREPFSILNKCRHDKKDSSHLRLSAAAVTSTNLSMVNPTVIHRVQNKLLVYCRM